jgi:hypothetical protein
VFDTGSKNSSSCRGPIPPAQQWPNPTISAYTHSLLPVTLAGRPALSSPSPTSRSANRDADMRHPLHLYRSSKIQIEPLLCLVQPGHSTRAAPSSPTGSRPSRATATETKKQSSLGGHDSNSSCGFNSSNDARAPWPCPE